MTTHKYAYRIIRIQLTPYICLHTKATGGGTESSMFCPWRTALSLPATNVGTSIKSALLSKRSTPKGSWRVWFGVRLLLQKDKWKFLNRRSDSRAHCWYGPIAVQDHAGLMDVIDPSRVTSVECKTLRNSTFSLKRWLTVLLSSKDVVISRRGVASYGWVTQALRRILLSF